MKHHGTSSGRLAAYTHPARISTELRDMLLNPFERESLVHQTSVELTVFFDVLGGKVSERTQTILDLHGDEAIVVGVHEHTGVIFSTKVSIATTVWSEWGDTGQREELVARSITRLFRYLRIQTRTGKLEAFGAA